MACVGGLGLAQVTSSGTGPSSAQLPKEAALEREKAVLLDDGARMKKNMADDMAGLSYETRIFEKHDGKWKVAYPGYLLAGTPAK